MTGQVPAFRRRVDFEKGHAKGGNYGFAGMKIRFLLIGDRGASQFLMSTDWVPGGTPASWRRSDYYPSGFDLGYHWCAPLYEGQLGESRPCSYIGGACYYDGSGLAAEDVLRDFISDGERAVWSWLVKRYRWCLEAEAEMREWAASGVSS